MFLTRYRFIVPIALLLFAVALAFVDRRGSVDDRKPVVNAAPAASATEENVPADVNARPLVLTDRSPSARRRLRPRGLGAPLPGVCATAPAGPAARSP